MDSFEIEHSSVHIKTWGDMYDNNFIFALKPKISKTCPVWASFDQKPFHTQT